MELLVKLVATGPLLVRASLRMAAMNEFVYYARIYSHIHRTTYNANHYAINSNPLTVNFAVKPHA